LLLTQTLGPGGPITGSSIPALGSAAKTDRSSAGPRACAMKRKTFAWYRTGNRLDFTRQFTFRLTENGLVENFHDPRATTVTELHHVRLNGRHSVDRVAEYWHENRWTAVSMDTTLYCRRR